ncbi:MAG TPA: hypothetical protein VLJ59_16365 [Mycobacteriales bacterium]|nr:hypothetical protein [Mycobacteriales bacterium]
MASRAEPEPRFLSPAGERAWTWLRRHLDLANGFWLGFVFTADQYAERTLRERARGNRRLHVAPFVVLEPGTPGELADLLGVLDERAADPPGCTWVAAPRSDPDWVEAWARFLRSLNHRREPAWPARRAGPGRVAGCQGARPA